MSDLTERVARALVGVEPGYEDASVDWDYLDPEARRWFRENAAAALAAVADAPGLAEVLRAHRLNTDGSGAEMCQTEDWTEYDDDTFEDHLADVVRAWIRGQS